MCSGRSPGSPVFLPLGTRGGWRALPSSPSSGGGGGREATGGGGLALLTAIILAACQPEPALDCNEPGVVCTIAGTGQLGFNGQDRPADDTWLFYPSALAWDADGSHLVDDFNNMLIRSLQPDGTLVSVAGTNEHAYAIEGPALASPLENPFDIATDPSGGFLVAELHSARILRVDGAGSLTIVAGCGKPGYAGDGGPATQAFISESSGVAVHEDGRVFVGDTDNEAIRVVDPDGTITTLAKGFAAPQHLRVFGDDLYVAEREAHQIRRIDLASGADEVVAGTGQAGFSGDGGPATEAQLARPIGMTIGPDGDLYIADSENNVIRRVGQDGIIETVLGSPGESGFDDLPIAVEDARLSDPADVLFGPDGRLYVADMLNGAVRAVRLEAVRKD
jgi:sugar lactone lactonase YvrE